MVSFDERRRRAAVRSVKRVVEDRLLDVPGVTGVDIGEKLVGGHRTRRLAIVVSVGQKQPQSELTLAARVPARVMGVPTDVVEEQAVLHHHVRPADAVRPTAPPNVPDVGRTVVGGVGLGPCRAVRMVPPTVPEPGDYLAGGTLGVLARGRGANCPGQGAVMGLTTFHVACVDDAWEVGDSMTSPSRPDGGRCPEHVLGYLARAALTGLVNAAAVELVEGVRHSGEVDGLGAVAGSARPQLGEVVCKSGAGSGVTVGVVVSTDATVTVDFGEAVGVRTLRDQVRVRAVPELAAVVGTGESACFGVHGDSGSAVLNPDNEVVGLYSAGDGTGLYGFANPIEPVLQACDVELCCGDASSGDGQRDVGGLRCE